MKRADLAVLLLVALLLGVAGCAARAKPQGPQGAPKPPDVLQPTALLQQLGR